MRAANVIALGQRTIELAVDDVFDLGFYLVGQFVAVRPEQLDAFVL